MPSKKKKPAANPARGFATTSIAKKVQPLAVEETTHDKEQLQNGKHVTSSTSSAQQQLQQHEADTLGHTTQDEGQTQLHELSPEDLEKHLEQDELQLQVEKYGPQTQRAVERQVGKLSTDYRLLRGNATPLSVRTLISEDLVSKLVDLIREDLEDAIKASSNARKVLQEEEAAAKLWSLQGALKALGFNDEHVSSALSYTLKLGPPVDKENPVWALEECLDWLVLNIPDNELPRYDQHTGKAQLEVQDQFNSTALDVSGPAAKGAKNKKAASSSSSAGVTAPTTATPSEEEDVNVSDLDSDLDPDELLSTHLATREKLYELQPELFVINGKSRTKTGQVGSVPPAVRRLQTRLQKIEADVLFDQREADAQWTLRRNQIAEDVFQRRRMQLPDRPIAATEKKTEHNKVQSLKDTGSDSETSSDESDSDEDDTAFADLFAAQAPGESTIATVNDAAMDGKTISIINFGQIQGLSPWRVLEETCRARDSRVQFAYKLVSESAFSNRHAITITWSKNQNIVLPIEMDSVASSQTPRTSSFTMLTVATPDTNQSKAYISTFALFQIFSGSTKEEKAYLRLPSAFKDLYISLLDRKTKQTEAAERETFKHLRELVKQSMKTGPEEDEEKEDVVLTRNFRQRNNDSGKNTPKVDEADLDPALREQRLKDIWAHKSSTPAFQRMLQSRRTLPMHNFKDHVLATIDQNQVTILCGETGCGKSTQLPSFVLEHELSAGRPCKIYCTEPRRISAITLAQRVAEELGEHRNDVGTMRSLIGYAIRLESQVSSNTRLVYATTGIVLRMLESKDGFEGVTHIIVDEVHERSIETDFLLIIVKSLIVTRPELKVILMSATVDAEKFKKYFNGLAPIVTVPGRTFPVETKYLEDAVEITGYTTTNSSQADLNDPDDIDTEERGQAGNVIDSQYWTQYSPKTRLTISGMDEYRIDYDLIVNLIHCIAYNSQYARYSQAILVFLPGIQEIRRLSDMLSGTQLAQGFVIQALHSALSSDEQQSAFALPPPGMRKIVISTNIAETGVTIPDITCVIDTGKHKEMRFDERRQISRLTESFISRANAKQRRGRAGRVQEGLCFHLFTKFRHDERMADQQTPEMLRLSLQDLIMRVKICKLGDIQAALAEALDPPSAKNIRRAIDALIEVGALTHGEELTVLGQQLSKLPLDPFLGKLVLYGALFGCLDTATTLAALLTSKSPFITSMGARSQTDAARASFRKGDSDLLTEYNAYTAWRRVCTNSNTSTYSLEQQFCRKSMLNMQSLAGIEDLKAQLTSALADANLLKLSSHERSALSRIQNSASHRSGRRFVQMPTEYNTHNENIELVSAVIGWAFYPKLLTREGKGWRNVATNQSISIHPTSIIRSTTTSTLPPQIKYLSFYSILQSGQAKNYNANSLTPVHPLALLLLVGETSFHPIANVISVDGARLRFVVEGWKTAIALKYLRLRLREVVERRWRKADWVVTKGLRRWWEVWEGIVGEWERREGV